MPKTDDVTPNVADNLVADNLDAGGFARAGGAMIQLVAMAIALAAALFGLFTQRRRPTVRTHLG